MTDSKANLVRDGLQTCPTVRRPLRPFDRKPAAVTWLLIYILVTWIAPAAAQDRVPFYVPIDQRTPPGLAGQWAAQAGRAGRPGAVYFQPVEFLLPSTGRVRVFAGPRRERRDLGDSSRVGLLVGEIYRIEVSELPEFPGVRLYPSVEVIDRLHPPVGRRDQFPVPIELTREEIGLALRGYLVTRVVYLEDPRLTLGSELTRPRLIRTVAPRANVVAEADREGRPMVIVRLGGRLPPTASPAGTPGAFFGTGAAIEMLKPTRQEPGS